MNHKSKIREALETLRPGCSITLELPQDFKNKDVMNVRNQCSNYAFAKDIKISCSFDRKTSSMVVTRRIVGVQNPITERAQQIIQKGYAGAPVLQEERAAVLDEFKAILSILDERIVPSSEWPAISIVDEPQSPEHGTEA